MTIMVIRREKVDQDYFPEQIIMIIMVIKQVIVIGEYLVIGIIMMINIF